MSNKTNSKEKEKSELDDLDEIRQFLKKKQIQNDVLKKMIDKPTADVVDNKNLKK